ncbi:hypothetical protein FJZ55_02435, partial [Candidatus Woesearchaeota archaeon]|nr:hypothetical protein [Candidatus Woesearchaeota archaeon]
MLMIKRPGFLFRSSLLVISLSVSQPWVMAEDSVTPPVEEDTAQFDILEFRVEGSSRMDHRTLEKTVYPF